MANQSEVDRLLQKEWVDNVIPNLGANPWIRVYQWAPMDSKDQVAFFCGLIPNENVQAALSTYEWDLYTGDGVPSFTLNSGGDPGKHNTEYNRHGHLKHGMEPLVIVRNFYGLWPVTIDIAEEFRLIHNLVLDAHNATYVQLDDCGDPIPIVRMSEYSVDIRRKYLRQFLAVKEMTLVLYFERVYFSTLGLNYLGLEENYEAFASDRFAFSLSVQHSPVMAVRGLLSQSWVRGKTIIEGLPLEKCGIWPFEEEKQFEEFEIDIGEDDEPIAHTSNPDELADNFGGKNDAPHYLTSVFFSRDVLAKYYSEPKKFSVEDGQLSCGSKWSLLMDNSHLEYVVVFLGDLGRDLPHKEQLHWKRFNVMPDGSMSESYFRRSFLNQWVEAEDNAIRFQQAYKVFYKARRKHFGWDLFKPLSEADSHHFRTLRRPLTDEPTEFHEIVLSLSILLQESINIKELRKRIPDFKSKDSDGKDKRNIQILGEYLEFEGYRGATQYVEYLRMLQMLRSNSGTVHRRNEKEYQKAAKFFELDTKSTIQVADDIFTTLTDFLDSLREHFCPDESS